MSSVSVCGPGTKADVLFLLDTSGSVGSSDFSMLLEFVRSVLEEWDIGQDQIRIGVLKFSTDTEIEFQLDEYDDKDSLLDAVSGIDYTAGDTNTGMHAVGAQTDTV